MADHLTQDQRPALPLCGDTERGLDLLDLAEPVFLIQDSPELDPLCPGTADVIADYLAHSVAAEPDNLLRHTQRIFHHYRQNDHDGLYAALVDLFIALGQRGHDLRRRLLNGVRHRLRKDYYARLDHWLRSGLAPHWHELLPVTRSVLTPGIVGLLDLVRVSVDTLDGSRDPLVEAREHIEYSQLDEAQTVLEEALANEPHRIDLQTELLLLYRATGNLDGFLRTREKLQQIVDSLPPIWDDCERHLRKDQTP
ncbi:type IV pilus assembly protein FimV [Methylocaldum szegediense]|uniref:Tetratricopeptide repeat protein n=1 Tax=Methylocaldum szegediense TaxID=73780 RepID=A0ABM9I4C2_9GAMM|nr:hypothetical protein [Methylocaldum szegediense]CAI8882498.1 conserved protein of unknown function [Methylocaldum szegediense]